MDAEPTLSHRLREAGAAELAALVRNRIGAIDVAAALQALRNPFVTAEVIELLAARPALLRSAEVRRRIVGCPQAPRVLALRLLPGLSWRELMLLGLETQLAPALRRAADRRLAGRLAALATGEKAAIARRAAAGVLTALRHDPSPRVIAALLDNPRLTLGVLLPLLGREDAAPEALRTVAEDRRWGVRYEVRRALARNPHTPVATALGLLVHLRRPDQRAVAADPRLAPPVRRRAALLAGEL